MLRIGRRERLNWLYAQVFNRYDLKNISLGQDGVEEAACLHRIMKRGAGG